MNIRNDYDTIGDCLEMLPAICAASEHEPIYFKTANEQVAAWIPSRYNVTIIPQYKTLPPGDTHIIHIPSALKLTGREWFMSQMYFPHLGLPLPIDIPKPELELQAPSTDLPSVDVLLAPFAFSLAPHEFWSQAKWQALVDAFPDITFGVLGSSKDVYQNRNFFASNVLPIFDRPLNDVAHILQASQVLVSVVTGMAHLAFALDVPNIVLHCQQPWGVPPTSIQIQDSTCVTDIPVERVVGELKTCLRNKIKNAKP